MATYYSVKDSDLGTLDNSFGRSIPSLEVINSNATDVLLLTSFQTSPTLILNQNVSASYVALNTSNRNASPSATLDLNFNKIVNNFTFLDNGPNKFSLTRSGNPINTVSTPFHPNGWSGYFNGTSSFLRSPEVIFGSNNFTVECWVYITASTVQQIIVGQWSSATGGTTLSWAIATTNDANRNLRFLISTNGSSVANDQQTTTPLPLYTWSHVALTRDTGGVYRIFLNGVLCGNGTVTNNTALFNATNDITIGATSNATQFFNGYISNVRIVNETALYTTNFTPPTAAFGLTDNGGAIGATATPLASNVSLLTIQSNRFRDNSNSNLTLTAVGTPTATQISPFSSRTYSPSIHGRSIEFNGINSILSIPNNNAFNFRTGDFTIEWWMFLKVPWTTMTNPGVLGQKNAGGGSGGWIIYRNGTNNTTEVNIRLVGINDKPSGAVPQPGVWEHYVVTRESGTLRWFKNGVLTATFNSVTDDINDATGIFYAGFSETWTGYFNGLLNNIRIVKGQSLYTTNFTPPTANLGLTDNGGAIGATATPILSNVSLLINNNQVTTSNSQSYPISSFASSSSWNLLKLPNALSANNNEILNVSVKTSQPNQLSVKSTILPLTAFDDTRNNSVSSNSINFTLSSVTIGGVNTNAFYLSGTTGNNWMTVPASPLFNFNGDFTIEFWVNTSVFSLDTSVSRRIINFGADSANTISLNFWDGAAATNKLSFYTNTHAMTGSIAVADGNWHHVALTRYANTLRLFVDGVQSGVSTSNSTAFNTGTTAPMSIGTYNNTNTGRVQGYITNLRIIKDLAVYTQPFTVPSIQSVSATPETVFLLKDDTFSNFNRMLINEPTNVYFNGSGIFNGTNSRLSIPNNAAFNFRTGDFTIEWWMFCNVAWSSMSNPGVIGQKNLGGTGGWLIYRNSTQNPTEVNTRIFGNTTSDDYRSGAVPQTNVWEHYALTRQSGTLRWFKNGVLTATYNSVTYDINDATGTFYVGHSESLGPGYFNGLLNNIRIVKGQALYTTEFIPPTRFLSLTDNGGAIGATATPLSSNVSLLTLQNMVIKDNSNNTFTISNNNVNISNDYTDLYVGGLLSGTDVENRNITVDNFVLSSFSINHRGTVNFPLTSNKTLTLVGSAGLEINSGATLNIGTSSASIPLSTTHTINLSNAKIDVNDGGTFNVYGFPETTTTSLVSTHPIGSRVFTVTSTVSNNWRVGDILAFKPNLSARTSFDTLILSSFTGPNTFTTTSNSLCTHTGSADAYSFIPDVYNLTRNVNIQGSSTTSRGVIKTIGASKTNINYAQLNNLGLNVLLSGLSYDTGLELYHNSLGNFTLSGSVFYNNTTKLFNTSRVAARLFNSTNYLIGISSMPVLSPATGNFTAEAWIYPTTLTTNPFIFDLNYIAGTMTTVRPTLYLNATNYLYRADLASGNLITSTVAPVTNTWTHIAISRFNGSTRMFVNGVQTGSTYSDTKNYVFGRPAIGQSSDGNEPFKGYISTVRISYEGLYTSTFTPTWNLPNLSSTRLLIFNTPSDINITDKSTSNIPFTNVGGLVGSVITRGTNNLFNLDNTKINNNILSGTNFSLTNTSITGSSVEIKDNSILSTVLTGGLILRDVSGSINMSNNRTVGALGHGTHLFNTSLTGTYGALNYNSALQGMIISGANTGTIVGGSINSNREGVYINASVSNLNNVTFQNIIANNNSNVGFKVSGNNLNYLTPVTLNINGLTANNNSDYGFKGYNITGNLTSIVANNNYIYGIETSIGNGNTIFDGVTILNTNPTGIPLTKTGTTLSSASPFDTGVDGSIKFNGSSEYVTVPNNTTKFDFTTNPFTIEFWVNHSLKNYSSFFGGMGASAINTMHMYSFADGSIGITVNTTNEQAKSSAGVLQSNTWHHVALVRNATNFQIYVDGISRATYTNAVLSVKWDSTQMTIGNSSGGGFLDGFISNFRIVKGTALYNANFNTQSPISPRIPLSIIPNTVFLYNSPYGLTYKDSSPMYELAILSGYNYGTTIIKNALLSSASYLNSTALAISNINKLEEFRLEGSTLSATTPLLITSTRPKLEGSYLFHNSNSSAYNLSSLALTGYQTDSYKEGITVMRENGLNGNHYKYTGAGSISFDTVNVNSPNTVSERLTPWSVNTKLRSTSKLIPINTGESLTVSVTLQRSSGYTGAAPRLILVGNASLGYSDSVLATSNLTSGWDIITGTIPASLNIGVVEVYVDCSGNVGSGYINIDSWNFY